MSLCRTIPAYLMAPRPLIRRSGQPGVLLAGWSNDAFRHRGVTITISLLYFLTTCAEVRRIRSTPFFYPLMALLVVIVRSALKSGVFD